MNPTSNPIGPSSLGAGAVVDAPVAARANGREAREWSDIAIVFAQLALIAWVVRATALESLGFRRTVYAAVIGFPLNHLLPKRFRLTFFILLSLATTVMVLGGVANARTPNILLGLARTGTIVGFGFVLIQACHLPIGFWKRAGVVLALGAVAATFRKGIWDSGSFAVVWPVLAAMFMFRIIVYLYDVSTGTRQPTKIQSLAYFFLIPNVCALLFPVIDFRTFCQKYYDEEALTIYRRGARWMARGVIQLLIYRLVHQLLVQDASDVYDGTDLIQFVLANILLYLNVSGSFHLIIGILLLFGFNLPETNHRYFLARSFTDYWRRVNTYWRTFIMKVFYYPVFFRFKKTGQTNALVIATLWCFVVTWALHAYQTWWIKRTASLGLTDALFWTSLAVLVLANSLLELKGNRQRKLANSGWTFRESLGVAVRTALTFVTITVLWSLWNTPTLKMWFHIWSLADMHTLEWGGVVICCVILGTLLLEVFPNKGGKALKSDGSGERFASWVTLANCASLVLALVAVKLPSHLEARADEASKHSDILALSKLIGIDDPSHGRGYYENLAANDDGTSQYWETITTARKLSVFNQGRLTEFGYVRELIPNVHEVKGSLEIDTNRWGMRDREHSLAKPPNTLRVAFLGSSHVMGFGINANEMFEPALENRLNLEHPTDGRFEILNFGVGGESPMGQTWLLKNRVQQFHPDVVVLVTHLIDPTWVSRDAVKNLQKRCPFPDGFPMAVFKASGVSSHTFDEIAKARLKPYESEMLEYCFRNIVDECKSMNALPVCVFLPLPYDIPVDSSKAQSMIRLADEAGFITVDLSNIYSGYNPKDLMVPEVQNHSNGKAHALIANALYDRLTTDPRIELVERARRSNATYANGLLSAKPDDREASYGQPN